MISLNYGHPDCMVLYPSYNLNCKHRTRKLPNYNKTYVFSLTVPYYEEKKYYDKKINFPLKML